MISKKVKNVTASLAICSVLVGLAGGVSAAREIGEYDTTVPVIADFESGTKKKDNTSSAVNNVTSVGDGLVSWIESTGGSNITKKVSYNSKGRYIMDYSNASSYKGSDVRLNISTQSNVWSSVATKGTWSPDEQ